MKTATLVARYGKVNLYRLEFAFPGKVRKVAATPIGNAFSVKPTFLPNTVGIKLSGELELRTGDTLKVEII